MAQRCPYCSEAILAETIICPSCGSNLHVRIASPAPLEPQARTAALAATPAPKREPLSGQTLLHGNRGVYRIKKVIGQGGFGIVYEVKRTGRSSKKKREVFKGKTRLALKEFFPDGIATRDRYGRVKPLPGHVDEFRRLLEKSEDEMTMLERLSHESATQVFEQFRANDTSYIVMELLDGETLEDIIERASKLTPKQRVDVCTESTAVQVLRSVLEVLNELHARRHLHRDIKPANIVVDGFQVELLDFGGVQAFKPGERVRVTSRILTMDYAPLEQYGEEVQLGAYTDLYALSATVYEYLTGFKPPNALERANGATLVPMRQFVPHISKDMADLLERGLSLRIADRWQTAREMLEALSRLPIAAQDFDSSAQPVLVTSSTPTTGEAEIKGCVTFIMVILGTLFFVVFVLPILEAFFRRF
jgi:serine/threonine protein kinase